jgi:hypothetical protein
MLSAIIAYQVLQQERPQTVQRVKVVLEKHPWYANQWQARLQDVPLAERDLVLFMQASRWADDICAGDKQQRRGPWHYINWPFKPEGNRRPCKPELARYVEKLEKSHWTKNPGPCAVGKRGDMPPSHYQRRDRETQRGENGIMVNRLGNKTLVVSLLAMVVLVVGGAAMPPAQ